MRDNKAHKKGNRVLGYWSKNLNTGLTSYIALRNQKDMFKGDEPTVSEAMRKGVACWSIDTETLQLCRMKCVRYIGIKIKTTKKKDQGSIYLARLEAFSDPANRLLSNKTKPTQRYLPVCRFKLLRRVNL